MVALCRPEGQTIFGCRGRTRYTVSDMLLLLFLAGIGIFEAGGDVGKTVKPGSAEFDAERGTYRVTGAGTNMWFTEDAFHFVWKKVPGDAMLSADVEFVGAGKNAHRKAVLAVRDSLEAGAAYADVAIHGDGLTSLQYRPRTGVNTEEVRALAKGPRHVRIERRGERVMIWAGDEAAGPVTVALGGPVYIGIGVCSHEADLTETAVFSNLRLEEGRTTAAWRPRITGLAHVGLYVKDQDKAAAFYDQFLGFAEPYSTELRFIKINERQYLELFKETAGGSDRLSHISVETDDAEGMRRYLASRGIKVPDTVPKGKLRNSNFTIPDPDGHGLEFVQYEPDGWTVREHGKAMPDTRISTHMTHAGILVGALDPALRFYHDLLGFQETWRGSRDEKVLNWVNLKVPDGDDYIEFMLYDQLPAADQRGTAHHLCLVVPDIEKARETLAARPGYERPMEIRTGINRRRQLNLFDPDGTRVELMEPKTVDGKNVPPSKAAPPR